MNFMCILFLFFFSFVSNAQVFDNEQDKKEYERLMLRKPDIVSEHAKLEDYYTWDGYSWVWKEKKFMKFPKGKVTFGKMTIKYLP